jgi:hypothetical protein
MRLTVARSAGMLAAILVAGAMAPLAHAQGSFEGVINATMTGREGPMPVTITTKGDKTRMDMTAPAGRGPGGQMSFIMNSDDHTSLMLMHSQKMYVQMKGVNTDSIRNTKLPKQFEKTGKTETVAGIKCDDYHAVDENGREATLCAAPGMGSWVFAMGGRRPGASNMPAWAQELVRKGFFLLKVTGENSDGTPVSMEVTKVEKKSVPDSEFQAPSDYKAMSGMGGGMGGRPPRS